MLSNSLLNRGATSEIPLDCNVTRNHNLLVHKQTRTHLAKLVKWFSCVEITYILKYETFAKQTFAISRFFDKFAKVWNREIFDVVTLAKVNSRENVQFLG